MRRPPPIEEPDHRDRWIIPYADFITLLFAVFAVLYAISAVDIDRFERMSEGIRSALSPSSAAIARESERGIPVVRTPLGTSWQERQPGLPVAALRDRIEARLETEASLDELARVIQLEVDERGLVISLAGDAFFEDGSARLRSQTVRFLDAIAGELVAVDASLRIEGHTDDRAVGPAFPSNWEFSAARASAVLRWLMERGGLEPARLGAAGYAGFRPVAPNDDEENRALNRRVDLVVLSGSGARGEPRSARSGDDRSLSRVLDRLPPASPTPDPAAREDRARTPSLLDRPGG